MMRVISHDSNYLKFIICVRSCSLLNKTKRSLESIPLIFLVIKKPQTFFFTGVAAILYESRLGCLENDVPQETQDYISALHLMFSSFKTTMYAGAIPQWLRPIIPKPWQEFCSSWDGLFKFSKVFMRFSFSLHPPYHLYHLTTLTSPSLCYNSSSPSC